LKARNSLINRPPTKPLPAGTIRTTKEIINTLKTKSGRTNHAIQVAGALELSDAILPLHPYLLGVWLGDGTSSAGSITTSDEEIMRAFEELGKFRLGAKQQKPEDRAWTQTVYSLVRNLREAGVFPSNKHVPLKYLRASQTQRLELLKGLMDTDGTATESGAVEFTTTSQVLAYSVHELILSLGWKARLVESRATLYGRDIGPKWDIKWTPNEYVFNLQRKRDKQKLSTRRTTKFRYIVDAKRVRGVPMRCIRVEAVNGLFLAGKSFLPTHNSDALLMAALQFVAVPNYSALIVRKSYSDLALPGALMHRAHQWLDSTDARWKGTEKCWQFPSGATLSFGYLDVEGGEYRYQSSEYTFIAFDELTQFKESPYTYLFSRARKLKDFDVPIRIRSASNPGNVGHDWVKARFILPSREDLVKEDRDFIPARLDDNPHLDRDSYRIALERLDPIRRAQLLSGNWDVRMSGGMFKREWIDLIDSPPHTLRTVRFWDLAATEAAPGTDPDWTVGLKLGLLNNFYYVMDVRRTRSTPGDVEDLVRVTAMLDGKATQIRMEQEPGSGGKNTIAYYARNLQGYDFRGVPASGDKVIRAQPVSAAFFNRLFKIINGPWTEEFVSELEAFPEGAHDDQVDSLSGAFEALQHGNWGGKVGGGSVGGRPLIQRPMG
jgi:predicted phage terminase large subunit-like protein